MACHIPMMWWRRSKKIQKILFLKCEKSFIKIESEEASILVSEKFTSSWLSWQHVAHHGCENTANCALVENEKNTATMLSTALHPNLKHS
jgi:hypothetical protein